MAQHMMCGHAIGIYGGRSAAKRNGAGNIADLQQQHRVGDERAGMLRILLQRPLELCTRFLDASRAPECDRIRHKAIDVDVGRCGSGSFQFIVMRRQLRTS